MKIRFSALLAAALSMTSSATLADEANPASDSGAATGTALARTEARTEEQLAPAVPILSLDYALRANVNYDTGYYHVAGAPLAASRITIQQTGAIRCNIYVSQVKFTAAPNGLPAVATPVGTGATYAIPGGAIDSLDITFRQALFDDVQCGLRVFADVPDSPAPTEELLGAIAYSGGFERNAALAVQTRWAIGSLRFAVPSFCQGAEILEAGTVVDGVYYKATPGAAGAYAVSVVGGTGATEVRAAVNGPAGQACSIPVYGTPRAGQ